MKKAIILSILLFVLMSCTEQDCIKACDSSLEKCTKVMGKDGKNKCYNTYNSCVMGCTKKK